MKENASGFPRFFEIQTASYCNAGCVICPHKTVSGGFPAGVMSDDLFKDIIKQIGDRKTWGIRVIPYLNNEPFLDSGFVDRIKFINGGCPDCEVEVSTNLSKLDSEMQKKLEGCIIKDLRLSVFGFSEASHKKVMPGLDWNSVKCNLDCLCANKGLRANIGQVSLVMVAYPGLGDSEIEVAREYCREHYIKFELWGFLDRANNVSEFKNKIFKKDIRGCGQYRPLERMHILFNGKVILCCMDWRQQYVLGDLSVQTIEEVWNSQEYSEVRNLIYGDSDHGDILCNKCKLAL